MGAGAEALAALDTALAGQPRKDDKAFAHAMEQACILRGHLIRDQREAGPTPASRRRLEHLNSVLTVIMGGYFPLGPIPWDEVAKARGWLAALVREEA